MKPNPGILYTLWIAAILLAACSAPITASNPAPVTPPTAATAQNSNTQTFLPAVEQNYPAPGAATQPNAYPSAAQPAPADASPAPADASPAPADASPAPADASPAASYPSPLPPETSVPEQPPAYPAAQATVQETQVIQLQNDVYTCDLQGTKLPIWRFEVVKTYPHDPTAYTQGLIIRDGLLYEGTGLRGRSSLRKVALETGEALQQIPLEPQFFGEGITELAGKLYQITWQEKTGFVYDFATLKKNGDFSYETEGWGLTNDGQQLILSDGSDQLYLIDPNSLKVSGQVAVTDDRGPVYRINELEYVEGEVWGNLYQTACIARIDPKTGSVTGWIDLTGLHTLALQASQAAVPPEVPNGIAYDPATKKIYVTGKFWPTLYEITLTPAENQP